ncbi:hypothetical protein LOTGIDRAFT_163977 [Lottia gigantea]|uniref:Farnesoic acid O-methyl transferase domain-containing protein n=1 Tax=Lottia gigantea TaxID=225164 RepID=V4BP35_LOTGI|nr:hypothetical protein LOTGIDRAFT_163977 [Lottia gigantea]ESO90699.1 hypothetical protein LOTGIDRAFT_163977 [Lottia gigantea]
MDTSTEEIVMTAAKLYNNSIMRLERKPKKDIDFGQVHHIAGGPYKGILVNKTRTSMDDVRQSDGRLEFMAVIHQKQQTQDGDSTQDSWTIRFWFVSRNGPVNKNNVMSEYFRDVINPKPKNYIGFVKKALIVLREYKEIERVELEVVESNEDGDESFGPIKSFISVFTPNSYTYQFVPEVTISNKTSVCFAVKASEDAHVALSAIYGDVDRKTFEIALGCDGNMVSYIRDGSLGNAKAQIKTPYLLSDDELKQFWISWKDHRLEVGKGDQIGFGRFLNWAIPPNRRFNFNCISVSTSRKSKGVWEFTEIIDEFPDESIPKKKDPIKEAKKAKVISKILWIAKKERMLLKLEDAYPNSLTADTLFRLCKIEKSNMIPAMVGLKDLQKRGLIRELGEGSWVRIPTDEETVKHDVNILDEVPKFSGREKINIVIITSLYCEKLAVDAMIDNKITYLIHSKEGDSEVYTIGKIGKQRVVSCKLSLHSESQDDQTLAEDTINKLHKNFGGIQHVLMVGVGGAVPSYSDYQQHVRLGDVVVSLVNNSSKVYINCSKVEHQPGLGYKYTTKTFSFTDQTLSSAVKSLRQETETFKSRSPLWISIMEESLDTLKGQESNFHRPSIRTDRLYYTKPDGTIIECDHPRPEDVHYTDGNTRVLYGLVAGSKLVSKANDLRLDFAKQFNIKCYDSGYSTIFDSLEQNNVNSVLVVRGMSDYQDGHNKEWQCYASLAAASYMKALLISM